MESDIIEIDKYWPQRGKEGGACLDKHQKFATCFILALFIAHTLWHNMYCLLIIVVPIWHLLQQQQLIVCLSLACLSQSYFNHKTFATPHNQCARLVSHSHQGNLGHYPCMTYQGGGQCRAWQLEWNCKKFATCALRCVVLELH